jgi:hypothetical protein
MRLQLHVAPLNSQSNQLPTEHWAAPALIAHRVESENAKNIAHGKWAKTNGQLMLRKLERNFLAPGMGIFSQNSNFAF